MQHIDRFSTISLRPGKVSCFKLSFFFTLIHASAAYIFPLSLYDYLFLLCRTECKVRLHSITVVTNSPLLEFLASSSYKGRFSVM